MLNVALAPTKSLPDFDINVPVSAATAVEETSGPSILNPITSPLAPTSLILSTKLLVGDIPPKSVPAQVIVSAVV